MDSTLDKVLELRPDRIACYNYAHLPERFPSQRAIDRLSLPTAEQKMVLQDMIAGKLSRNGYLHIGLDHYVLPEDDLAIAQGDGRLQRNFQGYSVQMASDLVGLGVSAISQLGDFYLQNARRLEDYYQRLDSRQFPASRGCQLTADDKLRRHVIMELICNLKLDFDECKQRFGIDFAEVFAPQMRQLQAMQSDGLLTLEDQQIRITEAGRPFLRAVCMCFDAYLDHAQCLNQNLVHQPLETGQRPRFSATI